MDETTTSPQILTGEEVARRLGCHYTTVSRWRNGHRLPGVSLLNELSVQTEIPYEDLLAAWREGPKQFSYLFRTRILGEKE